MYCYIYLRLFIETKALIDPKSYRGDNQSMLKINRQKCYLKTSMCVNIALILGILFDLIVFYNLYIARSIAIGLDTIYLFTWSVTLITIFRSFKGSNFLSPKKRVFIIHAALLTLKTLAVVINTYTEHEANKSCGITPNHCFFIY